MEKEIDECEYPLSCEDCNISTGYCCGAIYWRQHGANICRECFETNYKLLCDVCESEMETDLPYCQDLAQLFCTVCNTKQCDKLVKINVT